VQLVLATLLQDNGKMVMVGCGPVAALMLLAYYDRAFGYHRFIKAVPETKTGMPEDLILKLRKEMKTSNFELDKDDVQTYGLTLPPAFRSGLKSYLRQHYDVDVHTKASTGLNTLEGVFEKSKELLDEGLPHVDCGGDCKPACPKREDRSVATTNSWRVCWPAAAPAVGVTTVS
jgi:hypothetical protein